MWQRWRLCSPDDGLHVTLVNKTSQKCLPARCMEEREEDVLDWREKDFRSFDIILQLYDGTPAI
jgi:hypothetical protein